MTQVFDTLKVGQSPDSTSNKLSHGKDSIAVRVQLVEHLLDDLFRLLSVHLNRVTRGLATLLVVHAVDGFQLVLVEDAVAAGTEGGRERGSLRDGK